MWTAAQIDAITAGVARGDLLRAPSALAETSGRTSAARERLRAALTRHCAGDRASAMWTAECRWRAMAAIAYADDIIARYACEQSRQRDDAARQREQALRVLGTDAARWRVSPTARVGWRPAPDELATWAALTPPQRRADVLRLRARDLRAARIAERDRLAAEQAERDFAAVRTAVLAAYARCGYRTCTVGHTTAVHRGALADASGTTEADWTKYRANKKYGYPEKVSLHTLTVAAEWLTIPDSARVVDSLLTLAASPASPASPAARPGEECLAATWVEQSRGTSLATASGVLYRRGDGGAWTHATTLTGARAAYAREARRVERRATADLDAVMVTVADSEHAGNCAAGTRDWIARHSAGRTRATAREAPTRARLTRDRVAPARPAPTAGTGRDRDRRRGSCTA